LGSTLPLQRAMRAGRWLEEIGAAGSTIGGIAVMHGRKTCKWRSIHSLGVALGIAATVVALIERARRMRKAYAQQQRATQPLSGLHPVPDRQGHEQVGDDNYR
jgi:hypothetical protein